MYRKNGEYGLELPGSTLPKVIENYQAKIQWDFHIQTRKRMVAIQLDIVVANKQEKAVVANVAIPNDKNSARRNMKTLRNTLRLLGFW